MHNSRLFVGGRDIGKHPQTTLFLNIPASFLFMIALAFVLSGCSPVTLTSWKNPKVNEQISKVIVWGMFNKLEYEMMK